MPNCRPQGALSVGIEEKLSGPPTNKGGVPATFEGTERDRQAKVLREEKKAVSPEPKRCNRLPDQVRCVAIGPQWACHNRGGGKNEEDYRKKEVPRK